MEQTELLQYVLQTLERLRDITGILEISGEEVDRTYVARWAAALGLEEIWRSILRRMAGE
ncbi:MAG: hypothetical protein WCK05_03515 [Planctomycetota bacterium]